MNDDSYASSDEDASHSLASVTKVIVGSAVGQEPIDRGTDSPLMSYKVRTCHSIAIRAVELKRMCSIAFVTCSAMKVS